MKEVADGLYIYDLCEWGGYRYIQVLLYCRGLRTRGELHYENVSDRKE